MTYYVARPLDPVTETPGDLFRVRILRVYTTLDLALYDTSRRNASGQQDVILVTDPSKTRVEPRKARQIIVARVGTGEPGTPRYTSWS